MARALSARPKPSRPDPGEPAPRAGEASQRAGLQDGADGPRTRPPTAGTRAPHGEVSNSTFLFQACGPSRAGAGVTQSARARWQQGRDAEGVGAVQDTCSRGRRRQERAVLKPVPGTRAAPPRRHRDTFRQQEFCFQSRLQAQRDGTCAETWSLSVSETKGAFLSSTMARTCAEGRTSAAVPGHADHRGSRPAKGLISLHMNSSESLPS